jgi:hypothetical protein
MSILLDTQKMQEISKRPNSAKTAGFAGLSRLRLWAEVKRRQETSRLQRSTTSKKAVTQVRALHRVAVACLTLMHAAAGAVAADQPSANEVETKLREALFVRTAADGSRFGPAELDILFFGNTTYLLEEPAHSGALKALEEFAALDASRIPADPLRKALLQRDLWQLFDWARGEFQITVDAGRRAVLRQRIAAAMHRVLLSDAEIAALPDNLDELNSAPGLDGIATALRAANGDWSLLGTSGIEPAAPIHTIEQKGRSTFFVLVHLPNGRRATQDWLATLQFRKPDTAEPELNRAAEDFPQGTTWALVRTMNLIDGSGHLHPTHLVESVQFRTYADEPPGERPGFGTVSNGFQHVGELQMNRLQPPHLRALAEWDRVFSRSMDLDVFESRDARRLVFGRDPPFKSCPACHQGIGNRSIRSLVGFQGRATPAFLPTTFEREGAKAIALKEGRPDWQELSGLLGKR